MKHLFLFCFTLCITVSGFAQTNVTDSGYLTSFDSTKIYYEVAGKGEPVILLHGFMNTGENWKKTALPDSLIAHGFKVIIPDLRGNGKSDKPHNDAAYMNDAEAKDIMLLADKLGLDKYSIIGYSRGSIIEARLLVLDKRIDKAVIGGMGADFTNPEWPRRKMFARALMGDTVKELESVINYVKSAGLDQRSLALQQEYQPSTSKEELSRINIPVLVVCGTEDDANGSGEELTELIPAAKFVNVPGDHGAAMRTKEFAHEAVKFLE